MHTCISIRVRTLAERRICSNGMERLGQAIFNAAMELCPDQAKTLKGTEYDPFYDDDRISIFLDKLKD